MGRPMRTPSDQQRSLDDLGTPLHDVTFCVLDIETTGGDRNTDAVTEIGAARFRGGECLGTFQTLVNPGTRIPPSITVLTGITESMVATAPPLDQVLPSLIEFVGEATIVGHNVGFDLGFLNAALRRRGSPELGAHAVVDTLALARRLVRDEVPDCRLGTLATRLRLDHRPTHRALDDTLATADLLHYLLERAGTVGVMGLDDLLHLPTITGHAQAAKLKLTTALPRLPGVYQFRDARGQVLYVGKATNLRQRVRSYFGGDDRRKVGALLRETASIDHHVTPDVVVAEVLELRLIRTLQPRYNRVGTTSAKYCYVRLTTDESWPRLIISATPAHHGVHIGPLPSRTAATLVIEAIQSVFPVRRCAGRMGKRYQPRLDGGPCTAHQLGRAECPCSGHADADAYASMIARLIEVLEHRPQQMIDQLTLRMQDLAGAQRFEEAAQVRDRIGAFASALHRQRQLRHLRDAGRVELCVGTTVLQIDGGVLTSYAADGQLAMPLPAAPPVPQVDALALPKESVDELACLARAIERRAKHIRLVDCTGVWAWPAAPITPPTRLLA